MRTRSVARASLAAAVALMLTVSAVWAFPADTFTFPLRLGFQNGDDWEPSIAADDSGHIYALWNHYVGFGGADTGDPDPSCLQCPSPHMVIQIYDPIEGEWGDPHALAPSEQRQDDPQIVVDPVTQYVYAAYMEGNKSSIVVARSTNQGATFVPVVVEEIQRGLDKIALAARDGDVYVVYHSKQKIFASFSHDDGETWETVQPIHNTNSDFGESLPSGAAIDSDGTAYFAWNGANNPGQAKGTINLFVTSTDDGGETWTTSVVDQSQAPPQCACGGWAYWGSQMAIGVDDIVDGLDRVYVLWNANEVKYGPHRMFFAVSTDGAETWSEPVDVSPLTPAGVNHVFPALVATGDGDVRIAWTDDRNGSDAGGDDPNARWNTYYRRSADGGATWTDETQLSAFVAKDPPYTYKKEATADLGDGYLQPYGDYFELDIDSDGMTVAFWGEGNSYTGPGNVWFARQQP